MKEQKDRTIALLLPYVVEKGHVGEIVSRFEKTGLTIAELKMMQLTEEQAKRHYSVHYGKPFFDKIIREITYSKMVAMLIEGEKNVVERVRNIIGSTNPDSAFPGSIQGDFGFSIDKRAAEGSDCPENFLRMAEIFFPEYIQK